MNKQSYSLSFILCKSEIFFISLINFKVRALF